MPEKAPVKARKTTRNIWILIALLVLAASLALRSFTHSTVQVRVARVERGRLLSTLPTNGKVEPIENFAAFSPKAGTVRAVYVHEGENVPAGKLLLAMDDSDARTEVAAALAALRGAEGRLQALQHGGTRPEQIILSGNIGKAKAMRDQAAANLHTLEQLQKQGAASASEVEAARRTLAAEETSLQVLEEQQTENYAPIDLQHAQANLANAKAAYASALDLLAKEDVHAPFSGTVYSVLVRSSDFVQAGDKLLQMADLTKTEVRAYFDEPEIGKLMVGQPVKIVWEAKPNHTWTGHVVHTPTTIVGYGTRNVGEALISVDPSDTPLLPNTNVTITVTLQDLKNILVIPREALRVDDAGGYVYQVVDNRLKYVPVKIGALNLTQVQILSGLTENSVVALSATDGTTLRSGLAVRQAQ